MTSAGDSKASRAERVLDVLNLVLADVRYGLGPYAAIYLLTQHGWDEAGIALAFSFGGVVGLVSQAPVGAMVDATRAKRGLLAVSVAAGVGAALLLVAAPWFWAVAASGVIGALAGSVTGATLSAVSLGVVGRARFARRAARNEALFHGGNAAVNLAVLAAAPFFGLAAVFWMLGAAGAASVAAALMIPPDAIDHDAARGLSRDGGAGGMRLESRPSAWSVLLGSRPLLVFAGCGALFHGANATMLGLVVQRQALADPTTSVPLAAACMIAAQLAMVGTATLAGRKADAWGRKPIFLAAFLALSLRAALYTVSAHPAWTVAVQLLDGLGVGVFGALFPVVVADAVRGSGRFNAALGGVGTVHSVGGILGGLAAGLVVARAGYDAAFLMQAAIAALGALLYWLAMPETRDAPPAGAAAGPEQPAPRFERRPALEWRRARAVSGADGGVGHWSGRRDRARPPH